MNGRNCPDYNKEVRECRDEGSIKGCGRKFDILEGYQDHIRLRNRDKDRICPGARSDQVKTEAETRSRIYSGPTVEIDLADSPEYRPVESPPSISNQTPDQLEPESRKDSSPERAVSPPPCDEDEVVMDVNDDGIILISSGPSHLPDIVTSINKHEIQIEGEDGELKPFKPIRIPKKLPCNTETSPKDSDISPQEKSEDLSSDSTYQKPGIGQLSSDVSVTSDILITGRVIIF